MKKEATFLRYFGYFNSASALLYKTEALNEGEKENCQGERERATQKAYMAALTDTDTTPAWIPHPSFYLSRRTSLYDTIFL